MPFLAPIIGAAGIIGGHTARIGITSSGVRSFGSQFVQSLPFGAGYSLGTYLGFPKNFQENSGFQSTKIAGELFYNEMPYYRTRYSRYGRRRYTYRYGRRYYRRYPRRYRRYY
jgi:hypothetical protein